MPNHVDNKLTIVGPEEDVAKFTALAASAKGDDFQSVFNWNNIVPTGEYREDPPGIVGRNEQQAQREAWGVKWGAYSESLVENRSGRATYHYQTPWDAAWKFYESASGRFPRLIFLLSFGGEGPIRGRAIITNGVIRIIANDQDSPNYGDRTKPEFIDDEDECHRAFDKWQNHYLDSHDNWTEDARLLVQVERVLQDAPEKELTTGA